MRITVGQNVRLFLDQVRPLVQPEQLSLFNGLATMLLSQLDLQQTAHAKQGRPALGVTIQVGEFGCVQCANTAAAAKMLGSTPGSVNVRLSQGNGEWQLTRSHPDTHNPMILTVKRGLHGEHSAAALEAFNRIPKAGSPNGHVFKRRAGLEVQDNQPHRIRPRTSKPRDTTAPTAKPASAEGFTGKRGKDYFIDGERTTGAMYDAFMAGRVKS